MSHKYGLESRGREMVATLKQFLMNTLAVAVFVLDTEKSDQAVFFLRHHILDAQFNTFTHEISLQ